MHIRGGLARREKKEVCQTKGKIEAIDLAVERKRRKHLGRVPVVQMGGMIKGEENTGIYEDTSLRWRKMDVCHTDWGWKEGRLAEELLLPGNQKPLACGRASGTFAPGGRGDIHRGR